MELKDIQKIIHHFTMILNEIKKNQEKLIENQEKLIEIELIKLEKQQEMKIEINENIDSINNGTDYILDVVKDISNELDRIENRITGKW